MNLIVKPWTVGKCFISKTFSLGSSSDSNKSLVTQNSFLYNLNDSPWPTCSYHTPCQKSSSSQLLDSDTSLDPSPTMTSLKQIKNFSIKYYSFLKLLGHRYQSPYKSKKDKYKKEVSLNCFNLCQKTPFLGLQPAHCFGRPTLVLDLDETLIHSSLQKLKNYSFLFDIQTPTGSQSIYVAKRPGSPKRIQRLDTFFFLGVDFFLKRLSELYEILIFTASLSTYANPVIDTLDPHQHCSYRLFREHCVLSHGSLVKDLSLLGRNLNRVLILDNSPESFAFQPQNAIQVKTWMGDIYDTELFELLPVLEALANTNNLCEALRNI